MNFIIHYGDGTPTPPDSWFITLEGKAHDGNYSQKIRIPIDQSPKKEAENLAATLNKAFGFILETAHITAGFKVKKKKKNRRCFCVSERQLNKCDGKSGLKTPKETQ